MSHKKIALLPALLLAALALAAALLSAPGISATSSGRAVPREFFGIAPQTELSATDVEYMRAGRIGSVRWPLLWQLVQPTPDSEYDWSNFDTVVRTAALGRLRVLPFLYGTPSWLSRKYTTLPIDNGRKRRAWRAFVTAAVERYGPGGDFWREHWPGSEDPLPKIPVRVWQVWNEANFFYFAFPVSPSRYGRLLRITEPAISAVDPGAEVMLSGLFGDPDERGRRGMSAADFLERLYRQPGIRARFDSIALHPYAADASELEEMTEEVRALALENRDPRVRLYITEMGWGSEDNYEQVSFEQGRRGQVRQLVRSYAYLIENRGRLNLKGTYWFSWKDLPDMCNFCDSVGFFRKGHRLRAKPSWHAFVRVTGGRSRP